MTDALQIPTLDDSSFHCDDGLNDCSNGGISNSGIENETRNVEDGDDSDNAITVTNDEDGGPRDDGYSPRPNGVSNEFIRVSYGSGPIATASREAENRLHLVMRNMGQSKHSTLRGHIPGNHVNRVRGAASFGHVHARNRDLMGYMDESVERLYTQMNVLSSEIRNLLNNTLTRGRELEMLGRLSQMGNNIFNSDLNDQLARIINDRARDLFNSLNSNQVNNNN